MKLLKLIAAITVSSSFMAIPKLHAGVTHSLQQTAITLQPGKYEARAEADLIMNRGGGMNVSGHFRTGIIEDMLDIEGFLGTGKTDLKMGALVKFNLLPDLPGQVALAFLGGYTYISDDYVNNGKNDTINVLSGSAILSKKMDVSFGSVSPYGGLQLEGVLKTGGNEVPVSALLGAEWAVNDTAPWVFFSELDIALSHSVFLLGVGGAYRF